PSVTRRAPCRSLHVRSFHEENSRPAGPPAGHQSHRPALHPHTWLVRACGLLQAGGQYLRPAPPEVLRRRGLRGQAACTARGAGVPGHRGAWGRGRGRETKAPHRPAGRLTAPDARDREAASMRARRRFASKTLAAIYNEKTLRIRAGTEAHRFIGIWAVVVDRRVFVRSWSVGARGWYRTFLEESRGAIEVGGREIPVRAV